jgi:hypothetical protein
MHSYVAHTSFSERHNRAQLLIPADGPLVYRQSDFLFSDHFQPPADYRFLPGWFTTFGIYLPTVTATEPWRPGTNWSAIMDPAYPAANMLPFVRVPFVG